MKATILMDCETISDLLLLVDIDIPKADIEQWTDAECREAIQWATATHRRASDNYVYVPKFPDVLKKHPSKG